MIGTFEIAQYVSLRYDYRCIVLPYLKLLFKTGSNLTLI